MAATKTSVASGWTEIAADISAVSIVQCIGAGAAVVELVADSSTPDDADLGVRMASMDTLTSSVLSGIGSSGKLWARRISGNNVAMLVI